MSPVRESSVVRAIVLHLRTNYGAFVFKTHGDHKRAGLPDLIAAVRGKYVAIEVKSPDGRHPVSKRQEAELARIRRAGGLAFVARSVRDVDRELESLRPKGEGQDG